MEEINQIGIYVDRKSRNFKMYVDDGQGNILGSSDQYIDIAEIIVKTTPDIAEEINLDIMDNVGFDPDFPESIIQEIINHIKAEVFKINTGDVIGMWTDEADPGINFGCSYY